MAGNFDDRRENSGKARDTEDFDLDRELEDLTSFLREMGVQLEEEVTQDEVTGGVSFDFSETDSGSLEENNGFSEEDTGFSEESGEFSEENSSFSEEDAGPSEESSEFSKEDDGFSKEDGVFLTENDAFKEENSEPEEDPSWLLGSDDALFGEEEESPVTLEVPEGPDAPETVATQTNDGRKTDSLKERRKVEKEVDRVLRKTFGRPFSWKREIASWVAMFAIAFALAFMIDNYLIVNATVPTGSMQNTIMAGDRMIGWRLSYLFSEPQRGDIIIFEYPDNPEEIYVKRVIGLPGETVTITNGEIYINDSTEPLEEDYLPEEWVWKNDGYTFVVPADSYLCLGDNRNNSHDARSWTNTYVTKDAILGQAILCYWPTEDIRWLN